MKKSEEAPGGNWGYRDAGELASRYDELSAFYAFKNSWASRRKQLDQEGRREDYRLPFQRDRDRIIHSRSFRRLKHKTQVYLSIGGDHYRTRLT
ncbi:unnamed protein product, partial [marine sediment metagenome]